MTRFTPTDSGNYYRMESAVTETTAGAIRNLHTLGKCTVTETVRRMTSFHDLYTTCHGLGNLLIAVGGRVQPIEMPPFTQAGELIEPLEVNVSLATKTYLESYTDSDNPHDLLKLWAGAAGLYAEIMDKHAAGDDLYRINPALRIEAVKLAIDTQ